VIYMVRLKVVGTGRYLPENVVDNGFFVGRELNIYDFEGKVIDSKSRTGEQIFGTTGIKERRRANDYEEPSDMGYKAAVKAIEKSGLKVDSLTGIISCSVSERSNYPNVAGKIQKKIGARNCFAKNIEYACAGFPEALAEVNSRVLRRPGNYLVVAVEKMSSMTDYSDLNSTLFGDGAGAAFLEMTEEDKGIMAEYSINDPFNKKDGYIFRDYKGFCRMPEGSRVLKLAVRGMLDAAKNLKEKAGWEFADVYVPHQANGRILDGIVKGVEKEGAIVFRNIEKYGNMSSATCAVALDEALEQGIITEGKKVIVASVGSGIVTSGVAIQF
jgi:3-oxoacyl-[acyl-carrier-protein] synthase III